jgi:hypothetical protein
VHNKEKEELEGHNLVNVIDYILNMLLIMILMKRIYLKYKELI